MKVLVTGATGYIGGAVARELRDGGHDVLALVRDGEQAEHLDDGMRATVGDLRDAESLRAAARDVDGVVHAASSNDERAGELDRVAVAALLDELAGSDRPFLYTSGLWLHGNTGGEKATEDSPLDPPMVVSWRPEIEELVCASAARGVRSVRIRPALVYGDGGGYVPLLLAPSDGAVRPIGGGENRWAVVHRKDLAELYRLALEHAPAGSVYLGVHGPPVRVADAALAVAGAAGTLITPWPREEAERAWSVLTEALLLDQVASGERAKRDLGWKPGSPTLLDDLRQHFAQAPSV